MQAEWPQHHFADLPVFEPSQNREFFRFLGIQEGLTRLVICLTKTVYKNTYQQVQKYLLRILRCALRLFRFNHGAV